MIHTYCKYHSPLPFFSFHFILFADFIRSHLDEDNEEVLERDLNAPPIKSREYKVYNRLSFRSEYGRAIDDIATKVEKYMYGASGILRDMVSTITIFFFCKVGESINLNMWIYR